MTVSYTLTTQTGLIGSGAGAIVGPGLGPTVVTNVFPGLVSVYHWSFSRNIAFVSTLTMNTVASTVTPGTFKVLAINDPDLLTDVPTGALSNSQMPTGVSTGTAAALELASLTINAAGAVNFNIDLAALTAFITTSLQYSGGWNGHLVLWLTAVGNTASAIFTEPTLVAFNAIDYANRDTGRSGAPKGSRVDRCPVTGIAISRQLMVKDGWRNIYVHPMAYDPPEPDDPEFSDYPDPNED